MTKKPTRKRPKLSLTISAQNEKWLKRQAKKSGKSISRAADAALEVARVLTNR